MAWDIRRTYYYLVCFATLLMTLIGLVQTVSRGLDLLYPPESYRPSTLEMRQRFSMSRFPGDTTGTSFSEAELERLVEEENERNERMQRQNSLRGLLGNLVWILVAFPVYLYHWRRVRGIDEG